MTARRDLFPQCSLIYILHTAALVLETHKPKLKHTRYLNFGPVDLQMLTDRLAGRGGENGEEHERKQLSHLHSKCGHISDHTLSL